MSDATAFTPTRIQLLRAIGCGGVLAGTADILFVIVYYGMQGVPALRILQSVAAGALGRAAASSGGWTTALLGLAFHFVIAFGFATAFCVAAARWSWLLRWPAVLGPAYGVAVWLTMQLIVLPLTAVPPAAFPPPAWMPVFVAHLVAVGPPIVLAAHRFLKRTDPAA